MIRKPVPRHYSPLLLVLLLSVSAVPLPCFGWGNGGYSADPAHPDYGTHDWIAEHAKNWLPEAEREWIDDNLNWFLYGTEYPDNRGALYANTSGYGDTAEHHNYYDGNGSVIDDSAANRAKAEYDKAFAELKAGRNTSAAIYAGSMSHYIADVAAFGHVMSGETHHDDYEGYVGTRTANYTYGFFESYLAFDGSLANTSAYDASIRLGLNTFADGGGPYTAQWMDSNHDWNISTFKDRCGQSLNLATNYVADVLHSLAVSALGDTTKTTTTITCGSSSPEIYDGDTITILGSLSPTIPWKTVLLTYTRPEGTTVNRTVTTGSDGSYRDQYKPDTTGSWVVRASWDGDAEFTGAISQSGSFNVKKKGCIIATATYGSELSPEVQFLREFRDKLVLNTFAGSSFMEVFNAFYYSFSPGVASTISDKEILRGTVRILLYPLICILHISYTVFTLLSFGPEPGIVAAGLLASSLIAVTYVFPWFLLLSYFKRLRPSAKIIMGAQLIWAASIFTMAVAEVTVSRLLMMISTGVFILVTMGLTTAALLRMVAEYHPKLRERFGWSSVGWR